MFPCGHQGQIREERENITQIQSTKSDELEFSIELVSWSSLNNPWRSSGQVTVSAARASEGGEVTVTSVRGGGTCALVSTCVLGTGASS